MRVIACVEDKMGMSFNRRRVSRDSEISRDILNMCQGKALYMEETSCKLFEDEKPDNLVVVKRFDSEELKDAYCFIEDMQKADEKLVEEVILYRFNRRYPADRYFNIELKNWALVSQKEFTGSSHDKITKEIYRRQ